MTWGYTLEQHAAAHSNTLHTRLTHDDPTGWRRLIGCLKLQVIFRKRATNYRALSRKITYEDTASYGSLPPCTDWGCGIALWETLQHSATHVCSTLAAIYCQKIYRMFSSHDHIQLWFRMALSKTWHPTAPHCNSLQITATQTFDSGSLSRRHVYNLQHSAAHCNTVGLCNPLQHRTRDCIRRDTRNLLRIT